MVTLTLFTFHRDLRLQDNTALSALAAAHNNGVIPVFIMPDEQILPERNSFFSHPAVQFMCECLESLDKEVKAATKSTSGLLLIRAKTNAHAMDQLLRACKAVCVKKSANISVCCNLDESEYAMKRDAEVRLICGKHGVTFHGVPGDYGLLSLEDLRRNPNTSEKILANLFNKVVQKRDGYVPRLPTNTATDAAVSDLLSRGSKMIPVKDLRDILHRAPGIKVLQPPDLRSLFKSVPQLIEHGSREAGLKALHRMKTMASSYGSTRDTPSLEEKSTTRASPHLKFGTISVREAFAAAGAQGLDPSNALSRELVFREFYRRIYGPNPDMHMLRVAYKDAMDQHIRWRQPDDAPHLWQAWTQGRTGIPLMDAGMRQLLLTGWTHNRVRMVVASVATRHMGFDWRACAKFYYSNLIDADAFSNAAGWQWAAGIGVDAAPFFRPPLNPFRQSKRFDTDAVYIKTYVPELYRLSAKDIHKWDEAKIRDKCRSQDTSVNYIDPVISIKDTSLASKKIWKAAAAAAAAKKKN